MRGEPTSRFIEDEPEATRSSGLFPKEVIPHEVPYSFRPMAGLQCVIDSLAANIAGLATDGTIIARNHA